MRCALLGASMEIDMSGVDNGRGARVRALGRARGIYGGIGGAGWTVTRVVGCGRRDEWLSGGV
jgi:hypothetical protein